MDAVRAHGVLQPLEMTPAGVVLDGRHRLRAARELGVRKLPVRVVAPDDEEAYIVTVAVSRRHLNAGQRAAIVVSLQRFHEERAQARQRQRANLKQHTEVRPVSPRNTKTRKAAAKRAGVSEGIVQTVLRLKRDAPDLFDQVKDGTLDVAPARRELDRRQRYASIGEAPPLPSGTFELILADPPWQTPNPHSAYAPEQYYPTMPLEQLKAMEIPAADNAVLYLWAINAQLPQALELMDAWGFHYLTHDVWVKPSVAMGTWTRNAHELILIGR